MARKPRNLTTDTSKEEADIFSDGLEATNDPALPELVSESNILGSVVTPPDPNTPSPPQPAPTQKFRVRNGGQILHRGVITILRPGKVLDEGLYDVPQIRSQGILLDLVRE